jgi:hypothetical protein
MPRLAEERPPSRKSPRPRLRSQPWKASAGPVRGSPVSETRAEAALKAERASVAAKARQIETEAAPIRYVAELIGTDSDSARAIRWLIALMVLCYDPLAIALTAAASTRR